MIHSVSGPIVATGEDFIVIEAAGIGFKVICPKAVIERAGMGKRMKLMCYFRFEQAELFGFIHEEDLKFFELLMSVSGIGPRNALKMMNRCDIRDLKSFIAFERADLLAGGGVSVKTASKIILELKNKIGEGHKAGVFAKLSSQQQLKEALQSLGYRKEEIEYALGAVSASKSKKIEDIIKEALKALAGRHQNV